MRLSVSVLALFIAATHAHAQEWKEVPFTASRSGAIAVQRSLPATLGDSSNEWNAIDIDNSNIVPQDLCAGPFAFRVAQNDGAVIAACGGSVVAYDPGTMVWSLVATMPGTVRSVVLDPFRSGAYIAGTTVATYAIAASEIPVKIAGPSENLRVVDLPSHTVIAGTFGGRTAAIQAAGCNINIDNLSRMPGGSPVYHGAFYRSFYRITVRTTSPDCRWAFHLTGRPSWLTFHRRSGTVVSKTSKFEEYAGSATFDVEMTRNTGLLRSGTYTVSSTSPISSYVVQAGQKGICIRRPIARDGTSSIAMDSGQFRVFVRRWGTSTPLNTPHLFRLGDDAGCTANALALVTTTRANGSTIKPQAYQPKKDIIVTMPYAAPNLIGDAALFSLRGNSGYPDEGAVATLLLPSVSALPPDLQITSQTMTSTFLAYGAQGGYIEITGSVKRGNDPKRRCAFDPALYTVMAARSTVAPHFQIVPALSGCTGNSPDTGRLTFVAPALNATGRNRIGAVFTPWGWAAYLFQPSGQ